MRKARRWVVLSFFLGLASFVSDGTALAEQDAPIAIVGATTVDASTVVHLILNTPGLVVVDTRTKADFEMGHIDGAINIVFYDRRGLNDAMTGVTMARSTDGGRSFVNHRINQEPFMCYKDVFLGDYIGVAAINGRVIALYSHFVGRRELAISAAVFRFKPRTQEPL